MAVSGFETVKVLTAALSRPSFTAEELADIADVSRATTRNVLNRHQKFFNRAGVERSSGRGRPKVLWSIQIERLPELRNLVRRSGIGLVASASLAKEPSLVDAVLGTAFDSLTEAFDKIDGDVESARALLAASKNDLVTAGFTRDGQPLPNLEPDRAMSAKASLIAAFSDLAEARISGDQEFFIKALSHALTVLVQTKPEVSAEEWNPMVKLVKATVSTVLTAPVAVSREDWPYFTELFPSLTEVARTVLDSVVSICAVDGRIRATVEALHQPMQPVVTVVHGAATLDDLRIGTRGIVVGASYADVTGADDHGAHYVDGHSRCVGYRIAAEVAEIAFYDPPAREQDPEAFEPTQWITSR